MVGLLATRRTRVSSIVCTVALLLLGGCSGSPESTSGEVAPDIGQPVAVAGGSYLDVTVAELQAMLQGKDFPLINVHVPFEGDLPGTDDSIPFDEITVHLDRLPSERDATIFLYCRTGRMSAIAAEELVALGYTGVVHLAEGFVAWREAGLPMIHE
jgi:phage shock protein E